MMAVALRIDKLYRTVDANLDVVFVIRREDHLPRTAWIADEETRSRADESPDDLVQRALCRYRIEHPARCPVGTLIVDCSR